MSQYESAKSMQKDIATVIADLEKYRELIDEESWYSLLNEQKNLDSRIREAEDRNRTLRIGIIGAVKAGKSSFLNALFFDGKSVLPTGATSMTATLTKLTYCEEESAVVHFYEQEDWDKMEERATEYKEKLKAEYEEYRAQAEAAAKKEQEKAGAVKPKKDAFGKVQEKKGAVILSKAEYEKSFKDRKDNEQIGSAYETVTAAQNRKADLSMLGRVQSVSGSWEELQEYIGGDGKYTPLVSYVEMKSANPALEGYEIVDTPGLNDAITSRSMKTKEFLEKCDVVLLLSRCSQFMDAETIGLMCRTLPASNISRVVVIGSRLDSGIGNEPAGDFSRAYAHSIQNYLDSFRMNLKRIRETELSTEERNLVMMMSEDLENEQERKNTLFVSSMLYSAGVKMDNGIPLTAEEKKGLEIVSRFSGMEFTPKNLRKISNMITVKKRLNEIMQERQSIIDERDNNFVFAKWRRIAELLKYIQGNLKNDREKLATQSLEELQKRFSLVSEVLERCDKKISSVFEVAALDCERRSLKMKAMLTNEISNYKGFKTNTETREETNLYKVGFIKKEIVKDIIKTYTANTSQVKVNIQRYAAKCIEILSDEFLYMISEDKISHDVKEIVLETFRCGEGEYNEDDILIPLAVVLKRIQIPTVDVNITPYIDRINSEYTKGYALNDEIHKLDSAQSSILIAINHDYEKSLDQCVESVKKIMQEQAICFVDEIRKKLNADMSKLTTQMQEKEKYIAMYEAFSKCIDMEKERLLVYSK